MLLVLASHASSKDHAVAEVEAVAVGVWKGGGDGGGGRGGGSFFGINKHSGRGKANWCSYDCKHLQNSLDVVFEE